MKSYRQEMTDDRQMPSSHNRKQKFKQYMGNKIKPTTN